MSWIDVSIINITIVAIGTKKFVLISILYGGNHSPNSEHHAFNRHIKSNMPQKLLLFPSNKQKNLKCKNTRIVIMLVLTVGIATRPKNSNC